MSNNIKDKKAIEFLAKNIAHNIISVNTDFRGNLFKLVGDELQKNGQGFTSKILFHAAEKYGVNDDL